MAIDVRTRMLAACTGGLLALAVTAPAWADSAPPAPGGGTQVNATQGVPHLSSPQNLPPGTTDTPMDPPPSPGLDYLRDVWTAVQTHQVSGREALLLLAQRPLDADAVPPPGMPAGPQQPLAPDPATP